LRIVGILYAILGGLLSIAAFVRGKHSLHDFADPPKNGMDYHWRKTAMPTIGQEDKRVFGRPFVTAGWIVLCVAVIVATVEVTLLAFLLKI
jgi:hypothetical protein